jgi:hypothetical protein
MRNNRARYRLAVAPGQPAVSYVGYSPASWTSGALPG